MSHKSILYSKIIPSSETPKLLIFLMRNKVARTETGALCFLVFAIVISFTLSVYFFSSYNVGRASPTFFVGEYALPLPS